MKSQTRGNLNICLIKPNTFILFDMKKIRTISHTPYHRCSISLAYNHRKRRERINRIQISHAHRIQRRSALSAKLPNVQRIPQFHKWIESNWNDLRSPFSVFRSPFSISRKEVNPLHFQVIHEAKDVCLIFYFLYLYYYNFYYVFSFPCWFDSNMHMGDCCTEAMWHK